MFAAVCESSVAGLTNFLARWGWDTEIVPHHPYYPDLAPNDSNYKESHTTVSITFLHRGKKDGTSVSISRVNILNVGEILSSKCK